MQVSSIVARFELIVVYFAGFF